MTRPIEAVDLRAIREAAGPHVEDEDWKTSEALKRHFAAAKLDRDPLFLTEDEFFQVAHWKLITEYGRAARYLEKNRVDQIEHVTGHLFAISDPMTRTWSRKVTTPMARANNADGRAVPP